LGSRGKGAWKRCRGPEKQRAYNNPLVPDYFGFLNLLFPLLPPSNFLSFDLPGARYCPSAHNPSLFIPLSTPPSCSPSSRDK
jgi:hypothetical protein